MTSSTLHTANYLPPGNKSLTKCQQLASHLTERAEIGSRLSRRYDQLMRNEKYCDCQFNVATTKIRCHKLILAAASPVFEAMFYGPIRENEEEIQIDDISAEIFQLLVAYIYTGSLDFEQMSLEETIELYYSAEKYLLNELIQDCLVAVTRKLRFENILPALELSVCMNLSGLLDICMSFFTRCCLGDAQYVCYLKSNNQHHVSKECIKAIIAANKNFQSQLLWFVLGWCHQECQELGLEKSDCALIIDDLELEKTENALGLNGNLLTESSSSLSISSQYLTIERTYYKACRPFVIDNDVNSWKLTLKCERFISLHGIVIHSRLMPATFPQNVPNEYNENVSIEISAKSNGGNEQAAAAAAPLVWRHVVAKLPTKYNCDLNIRWNNGVVLSPDIQYEVTLSWSPDAFGAEYPCSLMSNNVDGVEFCDLSSCFGSMIKGISYLNLV